LKPVIHIKSDNTADENETVLLLIAGLGNCSLAVMNQLTKELVEFGYYQGEDGEMDYPAFWEENDIFKKRHRQTAVAFDTQEAVLIPPAHYHYAELALHFDAVFGHRAQSAVVAEHLLNQNLYHAYRLPTHLHAAFVTKFLNGKSWHIRTAMLENLEPRETAYIQVDFKTDEATLIAVRDNILLLSKSFPYSAPEDVLYQLLKCCQQFGLQQQDVKLILSGLIEKDSALYRELYKFFIRLEFDGLYGQTSLTEELKKYPDHYYSSITKLAACAL
jgi:hypothetical protein